ncbi:hypothetical protein GCM10022403_084890 [Streptomyces coacervatus]|uniref:Uncharacterized protein n=1 Tax=Streptomyces coacervatus TaxID=647381 RepID=A0ABP7JBN4_9ACTN
MSAAQVSGPARCRDAEVTYFRTVEGLGLAGVPLHVVAFPQTGELRALQEEFTDEPGQVGGVGIGTGQGAQMGEAAADLVVPVLEEVGRGGVEEELPLVLRQHRRGCLPGGLPDDAPEHVPHRHALIAPSLPVRHVVTHRAEVSCECHLSLAFRQFQYPTPPSARPGGSQTKFMSEVSAEEQVRNKDLTLAAFRDYQNGIRPAGPGARDLMAHFKSVDETIRELQASSPGVRPGDEEVIQLLARRAKTLHLGVANYCWFADPSWALCLFLAGTPGADKPMVGMCDSARCPQATHHIGHRTVWVSAAENKKVFIGNIGRGQKDEKARLQKELDRDLRVLAEIDAATGRAV